MLLIDAIKPKVEKKLKTCLFFARLFRGDRSRAYKIKPVLCLFTLGLLAATKTLLNRNERLFFYM